MSLLVNSFEKFHLPKSFSRHMGLLYLAAATSGDAPQTFSQFITVSSHMIKMLRYTPAVMKGAALIAAEIDERLDRLNFEQVMSSGDVVLGKEPCDFIKNPKIITADDWRLCDTLDTTTIVPRQISVQFGNLMAYHFVGEKAACEKAKTEPEQRLTAQGHHLDLSSICASAISTALNPLTQKQLGSGVITHDTLDIVCPNAIVLGEVVQWHDDLTDAVKDIRNEKQTQTPSPNAFLAQLYKANALDVFEDYCTQLPNSKSPYFMNAKSLPADVLAVWQATLGNAHEQTDMISHSIAKKCTHKMLSALPGPFVKN